jgi:cellulose synthase/poly-beta-1,6-N-acetylglucosamine synthase-like glycosyltransferase
VAASLILYTLFVYAVVLNCIGIVCRKPCETTSQPTTTLIVPAHNEEIVLQAKLENAISLHATSGGLDIIVASDGSSDRTVEMAQAFEDQGWSTPSAAEERRS